MPLRRPTTLRRPWRRRSPPRRERPRASRARSAKPSPPSMRARRPAALDRARGALHAEGAVRDAAARGGRRGRSRPGRLPGPPASRRQGRSAEDWAEAELKLSGRRVALCPRRPRRAHRAVPALRPRHADPRASGSATRCWRPCRAPRCRGGARRLQSAHPGYRALKARLAELRASRAGRAMRARSARAGPARRHARPAGAADPRPLQPRSRRATRPPMTSASPPRSRPSRSEKGLPANGVLTPQTVAALAAASAGAGSKATSSPTWSAGAGCRPISASAPYLREHPGVPAAARSRTGASVHQTRVIVGKTGDRRRRSSRTRWRHVIVNPSWTVPPSILKKEFLPGAGARSLLRGTARLRVIRRGNQISSSSRPGERNALGYIKFIFPNQHAVYLHDTPSRNLFSAERRAFSHGCVRVDQPFRLAEEILGHESAWTEEKLRGLIGKGERYIRLRQTPAGAPHLLHPLGRRARAASRPSTTSTASTEGQGGARPRRLTHARHRS